MPDPTTLPVVPQPTLDALFRIGESLWDARPDVRAAHGQADSWGFWAWLMFSGAMEHAELQAAHYPLPPTHLTERVTGAASPVDFVRSGVVDATCVHDALAAAGFDFERPGRVLDFGCGCGRLMRVMARHAHVLELHGVDVDAEAVAFCRSAFDFAQFAEVPASPPTAFAAASFDAIYSYSIFSHLSEREHLAWLDELARITAPGGLIVLTVGGRRLIEHYLDGLPDPVPDREELRARLPELEREGFLFFPYRAIDFRHTENDAFYADWDLERYGVTFLLESYVRRRWLESFELVAWHAAPNDWQDFVVLRRVARRVTVDRGDA